MKFNLHVGFLMLTEAEVRFFLLCEESHKVVTVCFQPAICNGVKMGAKI